MQDITKRESANKFNFEMTSLKEAMDYSKLIADSDLAPKDYKGKPGNVLIAIQFGAEVGLLPLQAIQNIAVINGRPAIWGDAMIALVQNHPLCESIHEEIKNGVAYCTVKRRGDEPHTAKFSMDDAKKASLLGKAGPWSSYPERMLQMRARGFALRDKFSDVLKGIALREEVEDYQVVSVTGNNNAENKIKELIAEKTKPLALDSPISSRIDMMTKKFDSLGVTVEDLENRMCHKIELTTDLEMEELQTMYKSLKEGFAIKSDFFDIKEPPKDDKK
jgi:hypothetical protein